MKQKTLISLVSIAILCLSWCTLVPENNIQENETNPASDYCEQNWGALEVVPDEWWSRWKCNFEDGSFCEERAYYHWECSPGRWDGNTFDVEEIQGSEEITAEEKEEIAGVIDEIEEINLEELNQVSCTADVKMCDDWTYVSRWWPNCQFSPCPWVKLDENVVQETLEKYKSEWSGLAESDIDLMREILNIMTE